VVMIAADRCDVVHLISIRSRDVEIGFTKSVSLVLPLQSDSYEQQAIDA